METKNATTYPANIVCESCEDWRKDNYCIAFVNNCKIIIKPTKYDHMPFVIIVVPMEHAPIWMLTEQSHVNMMKTASVICDIIVKDYDLFPNFFTGGNINNAKYGIAGVHAHIHIEPRSKNDPEYNTFPGHRNKVILTAEEIEQFKEEWKAKLQPLFDDIQFP